MFVGISLLGRLVSSFRDARNQGAAQIAVMTTSERAAFERYQLAFASAGGAAGALGFNGISHIRPSQFGLDMDAINQRAKVYLYTQKGNNIG